ncbi:MAG TPA: patatin-like phospholipase family protein [Acidimicrobiales bacterium]|nr:patatin-like phospholipase family protein [Acidimicrobiales bacterium]
MARVGLVLGAGGVTGGAFHAGVLAALEEGTGWDPRTAEVVLGTSAGSVTGAALRANLGAADLAARAEGSPLSAEGAAIVRAASLSPQTPAPPARPALRWRVGPSAPEVLLAAARRPWATRPTAVVAGLLPQGTVPTAMISEGVGALLGDRWPDRSLWITAVRLRDGRLVVFGRDGSAVRPAEAVAASCAIPSWFAPVVIGGERYIDGGVHSLTNAAQLAGVPLDLVVVSAPLGRAGWQGLHGATRRAARLQLSLEVQRLRRSGVRVLAFQPTREDQLAMGRNAMDASRRAAVVRQARASTLARLDRPDVQAPIDLLRSS